MYSNFRYIEDKLSNLLGRNVKVKKQSFYVDEQFTSYIKFIVDEKDIEYKIDLYDLTEYDRCGRLNHQLGRLAKKIGDLL